jgi:hypothetical protein
MKDFIGSRIRNLQACKRTKPTCNNCSTCFPPTRLHCFITQKVISVKISTTPWPESASELYRPSDRRLSTKLVPTFAHREFSRSRVTDPYGRNLDFLDLSRYYFFQAPPQLYSRGRVDPVPDPLLRKSGSGGNRTRTSGSVVRNSDH